MSVKPIIRQNIAEIVFDVMKQNIEHNVWHQCEKIPSENELAASFNVSRSTVRSAIHKLSGLGIVESLQGDGTYVCSLNGSQYLNNLIPVMTLGKTDALYVLEFRRMIECEGAAMAAQRITAQEICALEENCRRLEAAVPLSEECSKIDLEFHMQVACAAKNPLLIQVENILQTVLFESIREIALHISEDNALRFHKSILEALCRRDGHAAGDLMADHLNETMSMLRNNSDTNG